MGLFDLLAEALKRPIYSDKEAALDASKNTSQISSEKEIEVSYVTYDPFTQYTQSSLLGDMARINSHSELVKQWRSMSLMPEVDEALQEICNEAIVYDEIDKVIDLSLDDLDVPDKIKDKIHESFKHILYLLDFNDRGEEIFRQWYVDGTLRIEAVFDNNRMKEGIKKLVLLTPFNMFKYKDEKTGTIKYFYCKDPNYNIIKDFQKADKIYIEDQITEINSGQWDVDKKTPLSFLHKAYKAINQLSSIEDSLIIFRITRSPEKRVFYIDTGNLPKAKAEEYVRSLITKYRQQRTYDVDSGKVQNKSRQISILEDFWFPISQSAGGSRGTRVESLAGQNPGFGDFSDINYFENKVFRALGVPIKRKDVESRFQMGNTVDIEKDEVKFFKLILKLRRKFNNLFVDLLKKDLIAKAVFRIEDWSAIQEHIKFKYANSNEFSTIKSLQIIGMKMEYATVALQLSEARLISKDFIRKNIMRFTDEDIKEMDKQIELEQEQEPEEEVEAPAANPFGGKSVPVHMVDPEETEEPKAKETEEPKAKTKEKKDNPFSKRKKE
jgi:hypothetical protein